MSERMKQEAYHVMVKPTGPLCNLDCEYCFYLEKTKFFPEKEHWRMDLELMKRYIKDTIESQAGDVVSFAWQGGEPTLCGIEYFERIVAWQKEFSDGRPVENAFQTNGTLLNDRWAEFFREEKFLIGISIDGPDKVHDRYRKDRKGHGTQERVLQGLRLLQQHGVEFNTLTCVHRGNEFRGEATYRYLKGLGVKYMQFIPIVERLDLKTSCHSHDLVSPHNQSVSQPTIAPWSVSAGGYAAFMGSIFDHWVKRDVGKIYVQLFDVMLGKWMGMEGGLCVFAKTCGTAMAMEHNGDLYSCDHYVYPENHLGNISKSRIVDLLRSEQQKEFGDAKHTRLPKACLECPYLFACNGGCPKHRIIETDEPGKPLNYLCDGYRQFYSKIDPSMRQMADLLRMGRPPAEIMRLRNRI